MRAFLRFRFRRNTAVFFGFGFTKTSTLGCVATVGCLFLQGVLSDAHVALSTKMHAFLWCFTAVCGLGCKATVALDCCKVSFLTRMSPERTYDSGCSKVCMWAHRRGDALVCFTAAGSPLMRIQLHQREASTLRICRGGHCPREENRTQTAGDRWPPLHDDPTIPPAPLDMLLSNPPSVRGSWRGWGRGAACRATPCAVR